MALSYILLSVGDLCSVPPIVPMAFLGFGYAVSNAVFWAAIMGVCDESHLGVASGLVAGGLNLLPSCLPPLLEYVLPAEPSKSRRVLTVLAVLALFAMVAAAVTAAISAAQSLQGTEVDEGGRGEGTDGVYGMCDMDVSGNESRSSRRSIRVGIGSDSDIDIGSGSDSDSDGDGDGDRDGDGYGYDDTYNAKGEDSVEGLDNSHHAFIIRSKRRTATRAATTWKPTEASHIEGTGEI